MTDPKKVAILTNVIAPYRVPVYREIGKRFTTAIFFSGVEGNRAEWGTVGSALEEVEIRKSPGFVIRSKRYEEGRFFDYRFTHITPGYFSDLVAFRPDAVISSEIGFRTMAALAYGAAFRKPVWVWWGNTLHTERNLGNVKKAVRAVLSRRVPRWISYGRSSTDYLSRLGVRRDRILQIQNCVDEALFLRETTPALSLSPRPVLLCVGQLIARKGVVHLLDAASRLAAEGRRFTLLFVGGGGRKGEARGARFQARSPERRLPPLPSAVGAPVDLPERRLPGFPDARGRLGSRGQRGDLGRAPGRPPRSTRGAPTKSSRPGTGSTRWILASSSTSSGGR